MSDPINYPSTLAGLVITRWYPDCGRPALTITLIVDLGNMFNISRHSRKEYYIESLY